MNQSHYNTTGLSGNQLKERHKKNTGENAVILALFKENPDKWFTPRQVSDKLTIDIVNTRRAITTMSKEKDGTALLVKSEVAMFDGGKGVDTHAWKYNNGKLL